MDKARDAISCNINLWVRAEARCAVYVCGRDGDEEGGGALNQPVCSARPFASISSMTLMTTRKAAHARL